MEGNTEIHKSFTFTKDMVTTKKDLSKARKKKIKIFDVTFKIMCFAFLLSLYNERLNKLSHFSLHLVSTLH